MFERLSDEGLAQSSYLIACERTRMAAVIDPRRDIDAFISTATRHGLTIAYAIETHIHADFVSGARELAALGARVVAGPGAALRFPFHEAAHGESLYLGDISIEVLHTPGHTPEHISLLVREPDRPARLFTGDTLFVGAVGRPDLLGADQARALAGQLYDSLFGTLLALDDDVELYPGHGAGSLCGAGIGKAPHSTIGQERRGNPLLQQPSKPAFIAAVLDDLPETPPYFPRMKDVNRHGPIVRGLGSGVPPPSPLAARDAAALVEDGALVIDLRSPEAFAAGHPSGAMNIGFGPRIGYWAGWIVTPATPLVLLASHPDQAADANRQLARLGFDDVVGSVDGGFDAWRAAEGRVAQVEIISARELRDRLERRERMTLVDVRTRHEWLDGHIDSAINIPVGDLPQRAEALRGPDVVATICETGYRSSLASSLLERAGVHVVNVSDGTSAYRMLES
jgi:hydroxyacylglutathione hydrolase